MIAVLLGVLAALSWSLHDLIARSYANRIGAFRMAGLVMISGALLLSFFLIADNRLPQASWAAIGSGLLLGIAYGIGVGGLFKAFSLGPISLVGPITAGYPVLVVIWNVVNGLEPSLLQWAAVAATLVGAVIVARSGPPDGGIHAVQPGKLAAVFGFCAISMLGYACSVVVGQDAGIAVGEIEAAWLSRATALAVLVPFMMGEAKPAPLTKRHWLGILAMGGLDVLGLVAVVASGSLPGKEFAVIGISAYGAIAVILAMLVLKEKVSAGQWLGILLITGGVTVVSLSQ